MENKQVGYIIIGMAAVLAAIVFLFNRALTSIVATSCSHGVTCPMYGDIRTQTIISLAIIGIIVIIGIVLIFNKQKEKIIIKTKKVKDEVAEAQKEQKDENIKLLDSEEKAIYEILMKEGSMFQADLVDKSGFGKVKVTRILDKLEGRSLLERKRRGFNNIIILK